MSFLSFIGSSFTTSNAVLQLYRSQEFQNFIKNIGSQNSSLEMIQTFVRNFILMNTDSYVLPILDKHANIFVNKELSNMEKSKLAFGKMLAEILSEINFEEMRIFKIMLGEESGFGIGFQIPEQKELKKIIVEFVISQMNDIQQLEDAKSPFDVYRIIVEHYSNMLGALLHTFVTIANTNIGDDLWVTLGTSIMNGFNKCYEYKSQIYDDEPPNRLKRSNAMKGLPKQDNPKKPKN